MVAPETTPGRDNDRRLFVADGIVGTVSGKEPVGVLASAGVVVACGPYAEVADQLAGAETIELDGWIVPGVVDAHAHFALGAYRRQQLDLGGETDTDRVLELVGGRCRSSAAGTWVRASSYQGTRHDLRAVDLDRVSGDHPVVLEHFSGHWALLNSEALRRVGYRTPEDAPSGGYLGVDDRGDLDGSAAEQAYFQLTLGSETTSPRLPESARTVGDDVLLEVGNEFRRAGITGHCEAHVGENELGILGRAVELEIIRGRLWLLLTPALARSWLEAGRPALLSGLKAEVAGVKLYFDGAMGSGGAAMTADDTDHGQWSTEPAELESLVREFHGRRLSVAIHVNGAWATELAAEIVARTVAHDPWPGHRHRLEHATFVDTDTVGTLARWGIAVVPFSGYLSGLGGLIDKLYGQGAATRTAPLRSMLEAGVHVAGSSDYPCGPLSPVEGIRTYVGRIGYDGTDLGHHEGLGPAAALSLFTRDAASLLGCNEAGSLAPGTDASVTTVDADFVGEPETLDRLEVTGRVILGGPYEHV